MHLHIHNSYDLLPDKVRKGNGIGHFSEIFQHEHFFIKYKSNAIALKLRKSFKQISCMKLREVIFS